MSSSSPVAPATPAKKPKRWLTPVLGGVAVAAICLFGGILIGHNTGGTTNASSVTGRGNFAGGAAGYGAAGGTGARGGRTAGTITAIDGNTITVKLTDGSSVKVTTGTSTTVTKSAKATVGALAAGDTITVQGTTDSSGNVTATSVSEGALTGGFGAGGTRPATNG